MEGISGKAVSEMMPDDIQSPANQVEHRSFKLTGGWKLCFGSKKQTNEITFKQAYFEGVLVDLFLLLVSSMVMDGGFLSCITFFTVIAHLSASFYWALRSKGKFSVSCMSFIRVGALLLFLISIIARILMFAVFESMNIDWYL